MTPAKYLELIARARRDFPGAFPAAGSTRPLGVGTFEALVAAWPDLSKKSLRRFLNGYASNCLYRQALAASGPRYRLDGETDGEVTEDQRVHAVEALAARAEKEAAARQEALQALKEAPGMPESESRSIPQAAPEVTAAAPRIAVPARKPIRVQTVCTNIQARQGNVVRVEEKKRRIARSA